MSNPLLVSALLALLYPVYAVVQTIRKQPRPGSLSVLLACGAVIAPLGLLALNLSSEPLLTPVVLAIAVVMLIFCGVIVIVDYRNPTRKLDQSFGTLGLGVGVLLLVSLIMTPLILDQFSNGSVNATAFEVIADSNVGDSLVSVSFNTQQQAVTDSQLVTGQVQPPGLSVDTSTLQVVLQSETGLTTDELLNAIDSGSTLADLIALNNGDLADVTMALTEIFDTAISDGSIPSQMLERLGSDGTTIASNALNGRVPAFVLSGLLGEIQSGPLPGSNASDVPEEANVVGGSGVGQSRDEVSTQAIVEPMTIDQSLVTAVASTKVPTPTPFVFDMEPTATPVLAEPTAVPTCELTVQFNLNMRTGPSIDSEWIVTIPAYTTVQSSGHNDAGWWQVSFDDAVGWVSGEYLTADQGCALLLIAA